MSEGETVFRVYVTRMRVYWCDRELFSVPLSFDVECFPGWWRVFWRFWDLRVEDV